MMKQVNPILVAILLMGLIFISPGGFFVIGVALLIWVRLKKKQGRDGGFIADLFLGAFALRVLLLLITSFALIVLDKVLFYRGYPGWTPNLIGDAAYYTLRGYWIALDWSGFLLSEKVLNSTYNFGYGWNGYLYIIALFHYIFGFSPVSSIFLNCLIGSLSAVVFYLIAKEYLAEKVCRLTAVLIAFFPSLFLWSISNLKDTMIIFISLFILWSFLKLYRQGGGSRGLSFICIIIGILILSSLRKNFGLLMSVTLVISYFFMNKRFSLLVKVFTIALVSLSAVFFAKGLLNNADQKFRMGMYRLLSVHQASVPIEGSSYKILDDKYYMENPLYDPKTSSEFEYYLYPLYKLSYGEYFKFYLRAMKHFLFEPYIWRIDTGLKLLSLPQMIIWYPVLLFSFFGAIYTLRYLAREYCVIFIYFIIASFIISMSQGNIGTVFRIRDLITPVILFWAGIGIAKLLGWQIIEKEKLLKNEN